MTRATLRHLGALALALALAAGATPAAVQAQAGPQRSTETGRWLALRLEARDLTAPRPTVPGIGTFTKEPGRFLDPAGSSGSGRTFTKEPGDFEGPVQIIRVWNSNRIHCVPGYRCPS